jgi:hypothetical protein
MPIFWADYLAPAARLFIRGPRHYGLVLLDVFPRPVRRKGTASQERLKDVVDRPPMVKKNPTATGMEMAGRLEQHFCLKPGQYDE